MHRSTFLSLAALIALVVGAFATFAPDVFLATKGIHGNPAAAVWMRETGVALIAIGVIAWRIRNEPDSAWLRTFLWAIVFVQLALPLIELVAWHEAVLSEVAGVLPGLVINVLLAFGFAFYAKSMQPPALTTRSSDSTTNLKERTR